MNILDYINEHKSDKTFVSQEFQGSQSSEDSAGLKHDNGKTQLSLVFHGFPNALVEVAKVAEFGASKYAKDNWVTVANGIERYTDAKMRHSLYKVGGVDDESGLLHAAHEAWNALAVVELYLRHKVYRASIYSQHVD